MTAGKGNRRVLEGDTDIHHPGDDSPLAVGFFEQHAEAHFRRWRGLRRRDLMGMDPRSRVKYALQRSDRLVRRPQRGFIHKSTADGNNQQCRHGAEQQGGAPQPVKMLLRQQEIEAEDNEKADG